MSKTIVFKYIQISFDLPKRGVMSCHFKENVKSTNTLIIPTMSEGSKIWERLLILEESKVAAKPEKTKKRNI